jgi:hypothetical protein
MRPPTNKAIRAAQARRQVESLREGLLQVLRDIWRDLFDAYRPERHYMRGPGPKWRAKHT